MKYSEKILSGWGNFNEIKCFCAEPKESIKNVDEISSFNHLIARGKGRSYGDSSLPDDDALALLMKWQNKFLYFDKEQGLLKAEAGITFEEILDLIIPFGWFLPVTPGTRHITLGGALASNVHGKNHHKSGPIVNFVESFEILTEKGKFICTPKENNSLFYATIGGYGLTGIIQNATIKLKRIETAFINTRLIKISSLAEGMALCQELDDKYEYSVTWLNIFSLKKHLGSGLVMLGNHAKFEDLPAKYKKKPLKNTWKLTFNAPRIFPSIMLNNFTNKIFNFAYGNKFIGKEHRSILNFESWFFPLDAINNWNILYGKRGFIEYQFALPVDRAETGMREIVKHIQKNKMGSFLAVYKRMGDDMVTLPFSMPGYTLAIDFKVNDKIFGVMNELDELVIQNKGKIYLSKDSRLSASGFRAMYPEYEKWLKIVDTYSPRRIFQSKLSKRLGL